MQNCELRTPEGIERLTPRSNVKLPLCYPHMPCHSEWQCNT